MAFQIAALKGACRMKKAFAMLISTLLVLSLCSCASRYSVAIEGEEHLAEALNEKYPAGKEVVLKLFTVTEQYYVVHVDGEKISQLDRNMEYTYFSFLMPEHDVDVKIEVCFVSIPSGIQ